MADGKTPVFSHLPFAISHQAVKTSSMRVASGVAAPSTGSRETTHTAAPLSKARVVAPTQSRSREQTRDSIPANGVGVGALGYGPADAGRRFGSQPARERELRGFVRTNDP